MQDHGRFVNCVRYAPNGDFFVSGGAEGKVCLAFSVLLHNYCAYVCFDTIDWVTGMLIHPNC